LLLSQYYAEGLGISTPTAISLGKLINLWQYRSCRYFPIAFMSFFTPDSQLDRLGHEILQATWQAFPALGQEQIAMTWLVYDRDAPINTAGAFSPQDVWQYQPRGFSYRGNTRIYPASVVKLFYLVALQEWLEKGMTSPTMEIDRAVQDMIKDSSNDATSLIVDIVSGTTSGPELPAEPFKSWQQQRNIVNRYFQSLGWPELDKINVNQKTWGDGPYGRERAFVGELYDNRNMLTTAATARLLHSVVAGIAVSNSRSQLMLDLLQRDLAAGAVVPPPEEENQVNGFLGESLPAGSQLWSKAGWTSQVRHDVAYVEIPDRLPMLLAVFTEGSAFDRQLLPAIMHKLLAVSTDIT
jgi:beta-lactamase class A